VRSCRRALRLTGALLLTGVAVWFALGPLFWLGVVVLGFDARSTPGWSRLVFDVLASAGAGLLAVVAAPRAVNPPQSRR
jgi:hypothetical protein